MGKLISSADVLGIDRKPTTVQTFTEGSSIRHAVAEIRSCMTFRTTQS
jgi:hypothetical protein